jgi:hypothetical protein
VDAVGHGAGAQALNRQGIVDFSGAGIVDREGLHGGQRQLVLDGRGFQRGKAWALGEMLEQEAPPVELVGAVDGAGVFEQVQRGSQGGLGCLDHGLVLGAVLVGLEQDLVELIANRLRAAVGRQLLGPLLDLCGHLLFALDGHQGLLEDVLRCLAETALATAVEVMGCFEQAHQHGGLLHSRGRGAEVFLGQVFEAEFLNRGDFPNQIDVDVGRQHRRLGHQLTGRRLGKLDQHIGGLDLHALARIELDLDRAVGFGHHAASEEFTGVIKKGEHAAGVLWLSVPDCPRKPRQPQKCQQIGQVLLKITHRMVTAIEQPDARALVV